MSSLKDSHGPAAQPPASDSIKPHHLAVAVITTSGSWPKEGFEEVPLNQPLKIQLHRAADKLHIKDTGNWIARYGTRELNPEQSYLEQGLSGKVEIDYGPREGGGGRE